MAGQADRGNSRSLCRTGAFLGGLLVTFVAIEGVIGVYDDQVFYDHPISDLGRMTILLIGE
jgi:hypothetical protein